MVHRKEYRKATDEGIEEVLEPTEELVKLIQSPDPDSGIKCGRKNCCRRLSYSEQNGVEFSSYTTR